MIHYSIMIMGTKPGTKKADITETKAYGTAQVHEVLDLDAFCKHIADHNSPFSKGTVKGILTLERQLNTQIPNEDQAIQW